MTRGLSLLAFFVGNVCNIGLAILGALLLGLYTQARVAHAGMSPHDVSAAAIALRAHGALRVVSYCIGCLSALCAGFFAAKLAGARMVLHGLLADSLCFLLGLAIIAAHASRDPLWLQLVLLAAGAACATLGGYLASLTRIPQSA